jgi:hypothetical protein
MLRSRLAGESLAWEGHPRCTMLNLVISSRLPAPPLSPTERRSGHAINSSPLRRFAEGKRESATHLGSFSGLPKQARLTCTRESPPVEQSSTLNVDIEGQCRLG